MFGTGLALIILGGAHIREIWSADDPSLTPQSGDPAMKKTLFVLCLLSTTAAFAQYYGGAGISSQPQIYVAPSHPAHASYSAIAQEQTVLSSANYSSAQGERPFSDFPQPEAVSLGTVARELKKQSADSKKSRVIWVNQ
jgi:hypothetical protein